MKIPWISDLNRDGTPQEMEQNREVLRKIKIWVEHYYKYRMDEASLSNQNSWPGDQKYFSDPVDGAKVRIQIDQRVWPEGMPQLIVFKLQDQSPGNNISVTKIPEIFELEINGDWYIHQSPVTEPTMGMDERYGPSFNNILLDDKWYRKSDNKPLELNPRKYIIRLGLSLKPASERTGILISKALQFEVLKTD